MVISSSDYLPRKHLFYKDQLDDYGASTIDDISPEYWDYNELVTILTNPVDFHPNPQNVRTHTNKGVHISQPDTVALEKDVKEIIIHAWTKWYNNQTTVDRKIKIELWKAGVGNGILSKKPVI